METRVYNGRLCHVGNDGDITQIPLSIDEARSKKIEKSNAEILKEKQDRLLDLMNPNNSYSENESEILRLQRDIDNLLPKVEKEGSKSQRRLPEGGEEMLAAEEAYYDEMAEMYENDECNVDNSAWQGDCQEMG